MLQDRECQRYYQSWLAAHGSSLNVAAHVASIAQLDLDKQGFEAVPSRDRTLTAFAQLVAIRLDVRRCMVSLIDATSQYVLAEAARSHALAGSSEHLWLGSVVMARAGAICEHCMVNTCQASEENGRWHTAQGLIVNDCRLDERFKQRSYVQEEPGVRFYAGVPLMSRTGHMIGALAVSDDAPRDGLSADSLRYLQETAQAVMEHLEWARDRVDRFKGERIVRGMASFIEDCASVREETADAAAEKSRQVTPAEAAGATADPECPPFTRPKLGKRSSSKRLLSPQLSGRDGMSRMFASAADILRDSTLADGCAIFGATADFGRSSNLKAMPASLNSMTQHASQLSPASDSERHDTNTSDSDSSPTSRPCKIVAFSVADKQAQSGIEDGSALTLGTLERYCTLFPNGRTFSFNTEGLGITSEEESASEREAEQDSPNADKPPPSPTASAKARVKKRQMDHKELLKKIPGAQTVVFLPLYDHAEEKLVAGIFLWTSVVGRMLLNADLGHLRAFGNCIVSEVVRMNMQRNEAAKTTFIASMSHELRSPLHGILGASEFLLETATDGYQSGLITSIVTCGKTLLDTLNHVLDYSKINKLGRAAMRRRAKANKPVNLASDSTLDSLNLTADIDLGILVEEVAEAVTAGHTFNKLPESTSIASAIPKIDADGSKDGTPSTKPEPTHPQGVTVLLDISPTPNWVVRIQPGALRRIIMNLLGNALKYTSEGFVAVSLRAQETSDHSKVTALIRVVDSGKGMSESFMKDRLFVPFSQEDPFQPGTGLGLSIVKQIVDSLGGSIEVRSEQGVGTEIDIHLQLTPAPHAGSDSDSKHMKEDKGPNQNQLFDHEMLAIKQKIRGKNLVILDPTDPDHRRPAGHHASRFQQTLREICNGWFGMHVSRSANTDHEDATIYLFCEPPPIEKLRYHVKNLKDKHCQGKDQRAVPIVIICQNDQDAINMTRDQQSVLKELDSIVEIIPQPCGPRKLAKVFNHCLRRAEEIAQLPGYPAQGVAVAISAPSDSACTTDASSVRQPAETALAGTVDQDLSRSMSAAISFPAQPPLNPETPSLRNTLENDEAISPFANIDGPQFGSSLRLHAAMPAEPKSEPPASKLQCHDSAQPRLHLLLVDDNKINRQLLVMFTKRCNFTYREAGNGQEAVDIYKASLPSADPEHQNTPQQARFDFVLMDISMPILDGMEATRRIRDLEKEAEVKRTKVIALTGLASEKTREEAVTSGIDVFLPKPVRFGELKGLLTGEGK